MYDCADVEKMNELRSYEAEFRLAFCPIEEGDEVENSDNDSLADGDDQDELVYEFGEMNLEAEVSDADEGSDVAEEDIVDQVDEQPAANLALFLQQIFDGTFSCCSEGCLLALPHDVVERHITAMHHVPQTQRRQLLHGVVVASLAPPSEKTARKRRRLAALVANVAATALADAALVPAVEEGDYILFDSTAAVDVADVLAAAVPVPAAAVPAAGDGGDGGGSEMDDDDGGGDAGSDAAGDAAGGVARHHSFKT